MTSNRDLVLECRGIHHTFPPRGDDPHKRVLFDVNLAIERGTTTAIVGPSGCGKSTLLYAILGTLAPTAGAVLVHRDGVACVVERPSRERGIVFQDYALPPFLTARENVALGLKLDRTSPLFRIARPLAWRRMRRHHLAEADALLDRVHITAPNAYPHELSGGMRQRVAVAQALATNPDVLLLDEPFGALDEATRESCQELILELRGKTTILMVTHELNEALYVSTRVIGLSQHWAWRAEGFVGCPGATVLYDRPAPEFRIGEPRNYDAFVAQRAEIHRAVFNEEVPTPRGEYITYWNDVRATRGADPSAASEAR